VATEAEQDAQHLQLLSIFHYVVAGIQALFACFPMIHFLIGTALVFFPHREGRGGDQMVAGVLFMVVGGAVILVGWSLAALTVVAGRSLGQRKRYTFCLVVAAVEAATCMPFGTVLGVLTIIVLVRPSVKQAFEAAAQSRLQPGL